MVHWICDKSFQLEVWSILILGKREDLEYIDIEMRISGLF